MSAGNKKTFTLVELLVVIAIITLLMSILMPAIVTAKAQGRQVICRSNIRQLILANTGYATENDGFYVPAASDIWDSMGGLHRWHGVRSGTDEPFDPLKGPLVAYLSNGMVKECPERVKFRKGQSWSESFEKGCGGYGYNMTYLGSRLWQGDIVTMETWIKAHVETTRITEVARSDETLMFADTAMAKLDNGRPYYLEYSFAEPPYYVVNGQPDKSGGYLSPSIHFRHRDRANIGWVDGHVNSKEMALFEEDNFYGVKSCDMMLSWFEPIDNTAFDLK